VDALAQMVQGGQMFPPLGIQGLQHQIPLELVEYLGLGHLGDFFPVFLLHGFDKAPRQVFVAQAGVGLEPFPHRGLEVEFGFQSGFQARDIPLLIHAVFRHIDPEHVVEHTLTHGRDGFGNVVRFQEFVTLGVDHLTLVVGHIVVFQQLLADIEVAGFHLALGGFQGAAH